MTDRDNNAEETIRAIVARIDGKLDDETLHGFILSNSKLDDIYGIAMQYLNSVETVSEQSKNTGI
jgi:hypothetical protein